MQEPIVWGFFLTTEGVPNPMLTGEGDVQGAAVGPGVTDEACTTLGIPDDLVIVKFTIRAPAYPGYTYTCDATRRGDLEMPPDAPGLLWVTLPQSVIPHGATPLVLWRRRVTCDGLAVFLEARWTSSACPEDLFGYGIAPSPLGRGNTGAWSTRSVVSTLGWSSPLHNIAKKL